MVNETRAYVHTNGARRLRDDLMHLIDAYGPHIEVYLNDPERGLRPLTQVNVEEYHPHEGQGPLVVVLS